MIFKWHTRFKQGQKSILGADAGRVVSWKGTMKDGV